MMQKKNISIILFLCLFLNSCSLVKNVELIEIEEVSSARIVDNSLVLDLSTSVYNPNFFGMKSRGAQFDLLYDTLCFGKGVVREDMFIAKRDTVYLRPELNINLSILPNDFLNKDYHVINIRGFVNVNPPINKFYFEFEQTITISDYVNLLVSDLFEKEEFQIKKISFNPVNLTDCVINGSFYISNKNNLRYNIEKVNIEFYATSSYQKKIGSSEINSQFLVEPDSLNLFDFSVNLKTRDVGGLFFSRLLNKSNTVYIKLNTVVNYHNFKFPFSKYTEFSY